MKTNQIPLEELARLPKVMFATPSWSGNSVAYFSDRSGRFELYLMDLSTREIRQLTDGEAPRGVRAGFVWSRDDQFIVFCKDRDGDEQHNLFRLRVTTGAVEQLNNDPHSQEYAIEVSPDNARLLVASNRLGQMNLYEFSLVDYAWTKLTDFKNPVSSAQYSSDGKLLAFVCNESANLKNADVYVMDVKDRTMRIAFRVTDGSQDTMADWHPDGVRLAVTSDAAGCSRPAVFNLKTNETVWYGEAGVDESAIAFSHDGEWLLTLQNRDATLSPMLYRVTTGERRELRLPPGLSFAPRFVLDDAKLLLQHTSASRRSELLQYDVASDTYDVLLSAEYGSISPDVFVGDEYITYPSFDGQSVPALLYKPNGIPDGIRLPAIVHVHGGPTAQYFRGFDMYAQFLVDQGYVVLEPNVRGSTGYGREWRDANLMDWGGGDLEDVAAGAAYLSTLSYVDSERMAVIGGSYGGYMSFIASVKKPDVFKVAVPIVGISDLSALYDESMEHFKYYLRQQMGDPDEQEMLYRDRSATTHAEQLRAKMLILHGTNDPRCPIGQARLFRDRIAALGKTEGAAPDDDFEYHEFSDEGHGSSGDAVGMIRSWRIVANFLGRRL